MHGGPWRPVKREKKKIYIYIYIFTMNLVSFITCLNLTRLHHKKSQKLGHLGDLPKLSATSVLTRLHAYIKLCYTGLLVAARNPLLLPWQ